MASITHTKSDNNGKRSGAPPLIALNALIFDNSGSTESMGDAPVEQLHELMTQLKEDALKDNRNIQLSLHTFNSTITQVYPSNQDECSVDMRTFTIPSIQELRYILRPGGCTALYDAGIQGLNILEKAYKTQVAKIPKNVMKLNPKITKCYVLSTDGYDNSSESSIKDYKKHLVEAKKNGVQPLFLSANISKELTKEMGFEKNTTVQFQPTYKGMTSMLRATTHALRQFSSGATDTIDSQTLTQDIDSDNEDETNKPYTQQYDLNNVPIMPNLNPLGIRPPTLRRY